MSKTKELVFIGGHSELEGDIYAYLAEKSKAEGKIGYIDFASTDAARAAEKLEILKNYFSKQNVEVVHIEIVDDCYGLGVIYMQGGSPNKLVAELEQTGIGELLRPFWKKGEVLLSGSSAGAMALFWDMLEETDGASLGTKLTKGMGPMSGGFVVPHFNIRLSDDYKQKLVELYGDACIIGIDENTALRWRNGVCDVLGSGSVSLLGRSSGTFKAGEEFDLGATRK